MQFLF